MPNMQRAKFEHLTAVLENVMQKMKLEHLMCCARKCDADEV